MIDQNQELEVLCDEDRVGKYISIHLPGTNFLQLCEVQAFTGKCKGQGPFVNCHGVVDPAKYFHDCTYDWCATQNNAQLCEDIAAYAEACQMQGIDIGNWRDEVDGCALECPTNAHYELKTSAHQPTCMDLNRKYEPCQILPRDGCVCDDGFIFEGDLCIPESKCGCVDENRKYQLQGTSVISVDCAQNCICAQNGWVCENHGCDGNTECTERDGKRGCYCQQGFVKQAGGCVDEALTYVCEHETMDLKCEGQFIYVTSALYGRQDSIKCPSSAITTTACAAENSLEVVQNLCNGKETCQVQASNGVFGDPCGGTVKYLEINYSCVTDVCPAGVPVVRCVADPCTVTSCTKYPDVTCQANYCGGCNAEFYDTNGIKLTPEQCEAECSDEGESLPSSDPCEVNCVCSDGKRVCAVMDCLPPPDGAENCEPEYIDGVCCPSFEHCKAECSDEGESLPSSDPCEVNCVCSDGKRVCAVMDCLPPPDGAENCEPEYIDGVCCPSFEHCKECPTVCLEIYLPVCGTDGQTYSNECSLKQAACEGQADIQVDYTGECSTQFSCPNYFEKWGNKCYAFQGAHQSLTLAEHTCRARNSDAKTVLVESQDEAKFVAAQLTDAEKAAHEGFWLRCDDKVVEGQWTCINSSNYWNSPDDNQGFWDWLNTEPDYNTDKNCLLLGFDDKLRYAHYS
ncbi:zonadhesin-like isoform X2 [Amphiura filiformis]|uniref:zonadhesin-like isoform X2 n=1 Tax=Amphiura filiformis TaxID=82378 RepID=UPI003B20F136